MSGPLTKHAYSQLVEEDLEWLMRQPRCLERDHIALVLKDSVEEYYPPKDPPLRWKEAAKECRGKAAEYLNRAENAEAVIEICRDTLKPEQYETLYGACLRLRCRVQELEAALAKRGETK